MTRKRVLALGVVLTLCSMPLAQAQERGWPSKPVRMIVPFAAGGAADTIGRMVGEALSEALGQPFVIENRGGGGGLIGSEATARAEPDGYTLMISGMPSHVLAPVMSPARIELDPMRDFTHIAYLGGTPSGMVLHPALKLTTFRDYLGYAKAGKEPAPYVSPGVGSVGQMVAEYLSDREALKLAHVTYRGGSAAIQDLLAGHVKVGSMTWSTTRAHVQAGTLVALGITSDERLPEMPGLPTFRELGYPDLVATTWFSISGPAGLPPEIVERINAEVIKSFHKPRLRKYIEQESIQTRPMSPAELTRFMQSEIDKWTPIAKKGASR